MNVYFIVATNRTKRLLKIGKARDVPRRLSQIQVGCPYRLHLFGVISCYSDQQAFAVEKAAHEVFAKKKVRANGEWFRFTKAIEHECDKYIHAAAERFRLT